jgi:hypothetical protein
MVATRPDVVACGRVTHDLHSRGVRTLMRCCTAPPRLVPRTLHTQVALERRRTPASERTRVRYEPLQKIGLGFRFPAAGGESRRAFSPHRPREDGITHPADTSRANLAAALGLLSRWRLSKPLFWRESVAESEHAGTQPATDCRRRRISHRSLPEGQTPLVERMKVARSQPIKATPEACSR